MMMITCVLATIPSPMSLLWGTGVNKPEHLSLIRFMRWHYRNIIILWTQVAAILRMPLSSPSRNPIDRSVAETITIIIVVYRISSESDEIYRMSLGLWSSSVVLDNVMQFSPKMGMAEKQNFTCNKTKLLLRLFFTATGCGTLCTLSLLLVGWWPVADMLRYGTGWGLPGDGPLTH